MGEDTVVLTPNFLPDIAYLPDDRASVYEQLFKRFHGHYTGVGKIVPLTSVSHVAKIDILRRTAQLIDLLQDELEAAVLNGFGSSKEWESLKLSAVVTSVVAQVMERVFVGTPICRNKEWVCEPGQEAVYCHECRHLSSDH